MDNFLDGRKPETTHPCVWTYRIIGRDEPLLRAALTHVLTPRVHLLLLAPDRPCRKPRTPLHTA